MEQKLSAPPGAMWGPVATILSTVFVFFGGQIIGIFFLVFGVALFGGLPVDEAVDRLTNTNSPFYQFASVVAVEAITLVLLYLFMKKRKVGFKALGLKRCMAKDVLYALAGFGIYFVSYILVAIVAKEFVPSLDLEQEQELGFDTALSGISLVPVFLGLVVIPPIVEELLCRGFLYTGLRTKLKPFMAAFITSTIFAAAHLQWGSQAPLLWIAAIDTFILSLVLCHVRERTGSLSAPILIHALKNLIAFTVLFIFKAA